MSLFSALLQQALPKPNSALRKRKQPYENELCSALFKASKKNPSLGGGNSPNLLKEFDSQFTNHSLSHNLNSAMAFEDLASVLPMQNDFELHTSSKHPQSILQSEEQDLSGTLPNNSLYLGESNLDLEESKSQNLDESIHLDSLLTMDLSNGLQSLEETLHIDNSISNNLLQNQSYNLNKEVSQQLLGNESSVSERAISQCSGNWSIYQFSKNFVHENELNNISWKTRKVQYQKVFPSIVYATLKYEFLVDLQLLRENAQMIHFEMVLIDTQSKREVLYDSKGNSSLKGVVSATSLRQKDPSLNLSFQFSPQLSFHKTSKLYQLEARYYLPNHNNEICLIQRSSFFKIYARKPNKKNYYKKKRKASSSAVEIVNTQPKNSTNSSLISNKRMKLNPQSDRFHLFLNKMMELFELQKNLPSDEQEMALKLFEEKLNRSNNF